ncbi:MAG TPA: group III truncated hemoglobin [Caulobacteraceae bacterium]|nr:group III truncated hemoglobin [Caulobacteraceae bacterium]
MSNASDRRAGYAARIEAETGVSEAMITALVAAFYRKARADQLLGPVFAARITDWEPHLARMVAFWSSVMLMTGAYHGRPMELHNPLPIDAAHFDRWLELFEETARELCPPAAAQAFAERARAIGESLELALASANGVLVAPGDRYRR